MHTDRKRVVCLWHRSQRVTSGKHPETDEVRMAAAHRPATVGLSPELLSILAAEVRACVPCPVVLAKDAHIGFQGRGI